MPPLITENLGLAAVGVVIVLYLLWDNRAALAAKLSGTQAAAADDATNLFAKLAELVQKIADFKPLKDLGMDLDDLDRGFDALAISKLRHRVDEVGDAELQTRGYAALEILSQITLVPKPLPAAKSK